MTDAEQRAAHPSRAFDREDIQQMQATWERGAHAVKVAQFEQWVRDKEAESPETQAQPRAEHKELEAG